MSQKKVVAGSVTDMIAKLKDGDQDAARDLWERYFQQLVEAARKMVGNVPRHAKDEEAVAISAFKSLCLGAAKGNFRELTDRTDLWKLLVRITHQKVIDAVRYRTRLKRRSEDAPDVAIDVCSADAMLSEEATPETLAILDDTFRHLLGKLRNDDLRQIILARLEGQTNDQIAEEFQISVRSVQRKLRLVEQQWAEELSG